MINKTKPVPYRNYFQWLCGLIYINQPRGSYFLLITDLYKKRFRWFVPNDDNRAFEGRSLREQFCDDIEMDYIEEDFDESVSMLEIIIGLAYRCESIMADQNGNIQMEEWFWQILSNVELDKFTDEDYYDLGGTPIVDNILNRIIDRTYQRNGVGGLFPLKRPRTDQRKVELWYQMSAYLVENYYTEDRIIGY